jgi:hypothetical protein
MLFTPYAKLCGDVTKVGMVFKDESCGKKIFDGITNWNYNKREDSENNIQISFILEKDDTYTTYIYPSEERRTIVNTLANLERDAEKEMLEDIKRKEKPDVKEPRLLIMGQVLNKNIPNPKNSNFMKFISTFSEGDRFEFGAYTLLGDNPKQISGIEPIFKSYLKIKRRCDLSSDEIEYFIE